jgi:hypothetical protein
MGAISPYELRSKGGIDIAALSAGSKLLGKAGAGEVKSGQAPPRTLTMAFSDARTERRFAIWHAKQRWRVRPLSALRGALLGLMHPECSQAVNYLGGVKMMHTSSTAMPNTNHAGC